MNEMAIQAAFFPPTRSDESGALTVKPSATSASIL
jgi:hypothetical protein